MFITQKHKLSAIFVNVAIGYNVLRLCFVAEKKAKSLDLKTKITNTNRTSNYARYRNRANRCYK